MKANTYRMLKGDCLNHCLYNAPPPLNITLQTFMTNFKVKRCGIFNRHNYILYYETTQHP